MGHRQDARWRRGRGRHQIALNPFGPMPCHAADDGSLLWQVRSFPSRKEGIAPAPHERPMFPPLAFWHFLIPRDLGSSRALREVGRDAVRALLEAARTAPSGETGAQVRAALAAVVPEVTEPRIIDGVVAAVRQAATVLRRREEVSRRVEIVRSGALVRPPVEASDIDLLNALRGLVHAPSDSTEEPSARPATITAVAADGRYLRGDVDDETRRLSPPAKPCDWTVLLGNIDAVAWRLVTGPTEEQDRAALIALLCVWAEQPFAEPGAWRSGVATGAALAPLCAAGQAAVTGIGDGRTGRAPAADRPLDAGWPYRFVQPEHAPPPADPTDARTVIAHDDATRLRRLLDLLAEHGPLPLDEDAISVFMKRTGVRRAVAALVLGGLPRKANTGGDLTSRCEAHEKMLRAKPYQASKSVARRAEELAGRLGVTGRLRVLAAAIPDDPARLWAAGGTAAAAERMAEVWVELLGARQAVDEETATELERDLGMGDTAAAELADPSGSATATADMRCTLAASRYGWIDLHQAADDGTRGSRIYHRPYIGPASLLVWALTERPVGDPATAGVAELHARLRARLDAPDLLLPLGVHRIAGSRETRARLFGPHTYPVRPADEEPVNEAAKDPVAYDDGLLIVDGLREIQRPCLRPAGFADPGAFDRVARLCEDHGMGDLLRGVRQIEVLYDSGLARMVERSADTPVPAGGYEADPLLSVPDLVEEVTGELGTDTDAAALCLQLLTLARPTDRNVRRWNSWTAARHKAAQARLVGLGVVQEDKRSRAGRTVFLPGGWTEVKTPELPLESAKLDRHLATVNDKKELDGPFTRLLPPLPLHEMFTNAWAAR